MAAKKTALDAEIERLYRGPLDAFTSARNDLVKQLRKSAGKEGLERVRVLAKPTPSAWAVNLLFEREGERMEALLAAGEKARAGQRAAVSGKGVEALRTSLGEVRGLIDELRRRGTAILAESGRTVGRDVIERIGTDLQALALSPDAAEPASRRWLDKDLDPPGFEVLAGLQLAGAPVVDLAARRTEREEKEASAPRKSTKDSSREGEERKRQDAAERARREREEERTHRRIEVAEEKAGRARKEAESLSQEAATAEKDASEARRRAEAADAAAGRARDKADRAAERLARAEDEVKEAKAGR
ncbi:MAG TPA: hypothetical protein VIE43_00040 [Thermoanaerobaculia bacterium]|nr:hypothetical protein [Thermoanaerobaculia bacterium]